MSTATRPMPGAITGPSVPSWLPALTLVAGIALVALLATSSSPNNPAGTTVTGVTPVPHTVSVTGTGHVFLAPDVAELRLGVLVQRATVRDARDAAATASTAVVAALRAAGIAEADIQTSTLTLQPIYNYYATDKSKPTITGYELRNGLTITIRNLDLIGKAIDDAITAGATTVDSVAFDVSDKTTGQRDARKAAVADARARADTLASAAGSKITGVQSISESISTPNWPTRYDTINGGGAPTPVLPGVNELVVNVSIVYLIE